MLNNQLSIGPSQGSVSGYLQTKHGSHDLSWGCVIILSHAKPIEAEPIGSLIVLLYDAPVTTYIIITISGDHSGGRQCCLVSCDG